MFSRKCPNCNQNLICSDKKYHNRAIKLKKVCRSCSRIGWIPWNKGKKNCQVPWNKGKTNVYSKETIRKIKDGRSKQIITEKHKRQVSKSLKEYYKTHVIHNKGIPASPKTKRKVRLAVIRTLKQRYGDGIFPLYNPKACEIIDEYGKKHGYNFQHALNGGEFHIEELGYWVDGYDKEKNVVIEYYEKSHARKREKDKFRKQEIVNFLGCKFIELREGEI